jgi:hypothetical protein
MQVSLHNFQRSFVSWLGELAQGPTSRSRHNVTQDVPVPSSNTADKSIPNGWERVLYSHEGAVLPVYVNHAQRVCRWTPPEPEPPSNPNPISSSEDVVITSTPVMSTLDVVTLMSLVHCSRHLLLTCIELVFLVYFFFCMLFYLQL